MQSFPSFFGLYDYENLIPKIPFCWNADKEMKWWSILHLIIIIDPIMWLDIVEILISSLVR